MGNYGYQKWTSDYHQRIPDFSHGECQPVSQEYGFFAKNGRYIPGYRFISDSLTDNVSKIEKTIVTEMKKKIDAEIAKGGLK